MYPATATAQHGHALHAPASTAKPPDSDAFATNAPPAVQPCTPSLQRNDRRACRHGCAVSPLNIPAHFRACRPWSAGGVRRRCRRSSRACRWRSATGRGCGWWVATHACVPGWSCWLGRVCGLQGWAWRSVRQRGECVAPGRSDGRMAAGSLIYGCAAGLREGGFQQKGRRFGLWHTQPPGNIQQFGRLAAYGIIFLSRAPWYPAPAACLEQLQPTLALQ